MAYADLHCMICGDYVQAMSVQQQQAQDEDLFDFNNQLRHGIFEAYAGIINGMSPEKVNQYLLEPATVR